MEGANGDYHPDPGVDDDGFGYPDDSKRRERSRSRERRHKSSKEHRRRDRSRSRDRRRSRSRDKRRRGGGSRSRSRDRRRRSRSSRSRPRSRERRHHRRSRRSRSPSGSRSRSRSRSGGYRPRRRHEAARPAASMFATNDPFAHLRSKQPLDPAEAMRQWQEQMLKSRQLVLAQQAKSAVQAANKAQRELYIGNLAAGQVSDAMLAQVFNSALIAAFPEAGQPGQEPVVKVNIHTDGRYGFVEFRTAEYASAALELNGQINLMNQQLGIGRPASYVDPNKVQAAAVQAEAALAAFQQGLPLPPSAVSLPTALAPGSAGAAMAAAGNAAAGTHNAAAAAAGTLPLPPAAAADGGAAAAVAQQLLAAALLPTSFVEVAGMVTADALGDAEECEERALCCHLARPLPRAPTRGRRPGQSQQPLLPAWRAALSGWAACMHFSCACSLRLGCLSVPVFLACALPWRLFGRPFSSSSARVGRRLAQTAAPVGATTAAPRVAQGEGGRQGGRGVKQPPPHTPHPCCPPACLRALPCRAPSCSPASCLRHARPRRRRRWCWTCARSVSALVWCARCCCRAPLTPAQRRRCLAPATTARPTRRLTTPWTRPRRASASMAACLPAAWSRPRTSRQRPLRRPAGPLPPAAAAAAATRRRRRAPRTLLGRTLLQRRSRSSSSSHRTSSRQP